MALALEAYGAPGYEVRAYKTRQGALRGAARAHPGDRRPGHPARLARRPHLGHDRVPRGRRPVALQATRKITGTYILDPWYPRVSSIWGPSDPPGTFQNEAEMVRNFLQWKRPEGQYPDRDGLYIIVVPTIKASEL